MMDYRFVELNRERLVRALDLRGSDFDLAEIERQGQERRRLQTALDEKRAQLNALSTEIGRIYRDASGDKSKAEKLKAQSATLKLLMLAQS